MKKFFQWFKRLFGGVVIGAEALNTMTTVQKVDTPVVEEKKEVKQLPWFQRQNNLVQEFVGEKVMVYSSNLDNPDPVGYYDGFGNYVKISDEQPEEKEELLKDDVSLLKDAYKPVLEDKNTVTYKSGF